MDNLDVRKESIFRKIEFWLVSPQSPEEVLDENPRVKYLYRFFKSKYKFR